LIPVKEDVEQISMTPSLPSKKKKKRTMRLRAMTECLNGELRISGKKLALQVNLSI